MAIKKNLTSSQTFPIDLLIAKSLVYDKCGFDFTELIVENESQEYSACNFKLNELNIKFRASKITPTKTGQFVTIWERNQFGITQPFDSSNKIDFVIISFRNNDKLGQFIFPKSILIEKGIITSHNKNGKRGIRVYSPWDPITNKQAEKTRSWQIKYFLSINPASTIDTNLAKKLIVKIE